MTSREPLRRKRRREHNLEKATKKDLAKALKNVEIAFLRTSAWGSDIVRVTQDMHTKGLCKYIEVAGCEKCLVPCQRCGREAVRLGRTLTSRTCAGCGAIQGIQRQQKEIERVTVSQEPPRKKRRRQQNFEKATKEDLVKALKNVEKVFSDCEIGVTQATEEMHEGGLCDFLELYGCTWHFVDCDTCDSDDVDRLEDAIPVPKKKNTWVCPQCID